MLVSRKSQYVYSKYLDRETYICSMLYVHMETPFFDFEVSLDI